jgi:DNA-binding MltR family transcriptional regulator
VISRAEYEDAELLMALREELNHDGNEYALPMMRSSGRLANCTA